MSGRLRAKKSQVKAGRRTAARKKHSKKVKKKSVQPQPKSRDLLEKVERCLDSFQYEEAIELCLRAVRGNPDDAAVLEEAGPLLLELGVTDDAIKCLMRAVELSPNEGHLKYLYLGQLVSGEGVEAVKYLTQAISIMTREEGPEGVSNEEVSKAYCSLAEVYLTDACFAVGAEEKCHESCRKAIELAPTSPEAHQLLASFLLSTNQPQEAEDAVRKSLSLWLPRLRAEEEEEEEEEGEGEEGRGETPPYFSRVNCAKILIELHLYNEANRVLERLLRDDDEVILVWYLMGWLHVLTKDRDSAHFFLEQANQLVRKMECDDKQMIAHISELLAELDQQIVKKEEEEEKEDKEEEKEDEEEEENRDGGDSMDIS